MKRLVFILVFLVLVAVFLTGFVRYKQVENQPVDVFVTLHEFKVELSRTNLPAGVPIRFIFKNTGAVVHEAVLEKAGVVDEPLELAGAESEVEDIQPGGIPNAVWTIDEPGEYQLACHIAGHFEGGMVGTFTVRAGGAFVSLLFEYAAWIVGGIAVILIIIVGAALALRKKPALAGA